MSQVPPVTISPSENNASSSAPALAPAPAPTPKRRSCVVCRTRKVRCDKQSPCSNCVRGKIACVFPSTDRPPRWARRQAAATNAPAQLMERLQNLESLVKDLSGQLEQANAAASSVAGGSSEVNSPKSSSQDRDTGHQTDAIQKPFGRLVLQDANRSRYVSSGFWSRVNDELDGLGSDTSEEEEELEASSGKSPSTQELQRTPADRHAFLFRHNLTPSTPDLREFHPLPSQIPFLLDIFSENVNAMSRAVHVPTVTKMVRNLRGSDMTSLMPSNEALMFSIYYAAITSMEEEDIITNFGFTKSDLNLKYRLGFEHALSRADFLNAPDLVLVQAFTVFLSLARRYDSPRYVWMMTGLVIRMAQALGLHRDGANFEKLTPYEIEMRRRVWLSLCMLDVRASEDQGMEYTIALGSFDTKLPLNINDEDIEPNTAQMPTEREGITDMTFPLVSAEIMETSKQMMTKGAKDGLLSIEEQSRLLNEMYQSLDRRYLQYSVESGNIAYWVIVTVTRLVMAKMTLFVYLPLLFSSPNENFSDKIRAKLLVAAIEVAEYNHALNAEHAARHWRWIYQTYTHWHSIVYILIEISRRPWSPIVERAWMALHSEWLIPTQSHMNKNLRVWIPLRKLTAKARKHREAELERLRSDPQAAERLEMGDQMIPLPTSPGLFPPGSDVVELCRQKWRKLLAIEGSEHDTQIPGQSGSGVTSPSIHSHHVPQPSTNSISAYNESDFRSNTAFDPAYFSASGFQNQNQTSSTSPDFQSSITTSTPSDFAMGQTAGSSYNAVSSTWSMGPGLGHWLWADADPSVDVFANMDPGTIDVNMDLDGEVDWYNWVESAKGMESWDAGPSGSGGT